MIPAAMLAFGPPVPTAAVVASGHAFFAEGLVSFKTCGIEAGEAAEFSAGQQLVDIIRAAVLDSFIVLVVSHVRDNAIAAVAYFTSSALV